MDLAVLADIHSNHIALERCLTYAHSRNISNFIFLGDYVGELGCPEKTMQLLYHIRDNFQSCFIKGNKEERWLQHREGDGMEWRKGDSTSGAMWYSYEHLTEADLRFYSGLTDILRLEFDSLPPLTACHGSPFKVSEKMLPEDDRTRLIMESTNSNIILSAHTHRQLKITHDGKTALNPGSVGVPLYSRGKTQFLLLHGDKGVWTEEFISLDYDVERVVTELHKEGLYTIAPCWTLITEKILHGSNLSHGTVLYRAMELCREGEGKCNWPDIPEKYWLQAVEELSLN